MDVSQLLHQALEEDRPATLQASLESQRLKAGTLVSVAFRSVGAATTLERTGLLSPVLRCGCRGGQGCLPITAREAQGLWGCFIAILQVVFTSDGNFKLHGLFIQDWMIVCSVVSFCVRAWVCPNKKTPEHSHVTVARPNRVDDSQDWLEMVYCVLFFCDFYESWLKNLSADVFIRLVGSWVYHCHAAFKTSSTGFCFRPCAPIGDMSSRFIGFKIKSRMVTTMSTWASRIEWLHLVWHSLAPEWYVLAARISVYKMTAQHCFDISNQVVLKVSYCDLQIIGFPTRCALGAFSLCCSLRQASLHCASSNLRSRRAAKDGGPTAKVPRWSHVMQHRQDPLAR